VAHVRNVLFLYLFCCLIFSCRCCLVARVVCLKVGYNVNIFHTTISPSLKISTVLYLFLMLLSSSSLSFFVVVQMVRS